MRRRVKKVSAGVHFEERVLRYLDDLADEETLPRSVILNRIIKEYAKQNGQTISPSVERPAT